ncbi:putative subtilisin-like protease [Ophiocordyceps camponoti-saundersi (nom. inval.)]|nr:putative subtilisin-like protease [Ophiocordyceps camponoti-saundersi (nom. inval.)]
MAGFFALQTVTVLCVVSFAVAAAANQLDSLHVKDSYIITLRQSLPEARVEAHLKWVDDTHQTNTLARRDTDLAGLQAVFNVGEFRGYGGHFDEDTINEIRSHSEVVRVERNQYLGIHGTTMLENSTWGLGTISSRNPGNAEYVFDSSAGEDTWAYVLDTGINIRHHDFGGRAVKGADCGNVLCLPGGDFNDTLGHGTHVAGTIAGSRYGVAKKANIVDVKIARADNTITVLSTVSALSWAFNDMETKGRTNRSIVNLSIGGQCNRKLDRPHGCPYTPYWGIRGHEAELDIIEMMFQKGVLTVVASGNDDTDATWVAPAAAPNALTVGAIDRGWKEARFSNFGRGVDILAPGVGIVSAGNRSDSETRIFGGTSMATPHVTGLALYLKALENITDPVVLTNRILGLASNTSLRRVKRGSPNLVINNGISDKRLVYSSSTNSSTTTLVIMVSSSSGGAGGVPLPTADDMSEPPINGTYKSPINETSGPPVIEILRPTSDVIPRPPVEVLPTPSADIPGPPINDTSSPPIDDIPGPTSDVMPRPPIDGTPLPIFVIMPRPPVEVLPTPSADILLLPINDTAGAPVDDTARPTLDLMPRPPIDVLPTPSTDLPRPLIDTYMPPVDDTIGPPINDTARPPVDRMPGPPTEDTSMPPVNDKTGPIDYVPGPAADAMPTPSVSDRPEPSADNTLPPATDAVPRPPVEGILRPVTDAIPGPPINMSRLPAEDMPGPLPSDAPQPTDELVPKPSSNDTRGPPNEDKPEPSTEPTPTTFWPADVLVPLIGTTDAALELTFTSTDSSYFPSSNPSFEGSESDSTAPTDGPVPFQEVKEADIPTSTLFRNTTEDGRILFVTESLSSTPSASADSSSRDGSLNVTAAIHLAESTHTGIGDGEPTTSPAGAAFSQSLSDLGFANMEDHTVPSTYLSSSTASASSLPFSELLSGRYKMITIVFHGTTSAIPIELPAESPTDDVSTTATDATPTMDSNSYNPSTSSTSFRSHGIFEYLRNWGYLTLPRDSVATPST